jgi:hypothetical protein
MTEVMLAMKSSSSRWLPILLVAAGLGFASRNANADDVDQDEVVAARERCAARLAIAITGESPSAELRGNENPQAETINLLSTPAFRTRFARFVNATYNREPGEDAAQDAAYWMALHVLEKALPWKEMFTGKYNIQDDEEGERATVVADPNGLGYFRSYAWLERYSGNEKEGLKLTTAYRIAHNMIGLKLTAVTNAPNVDTSATGRRQQPCASCHHDGFYPLDKVAMVLTRKNDTQDDVTFDPPKGGPQQILGGITVANDADVVNALADSEAFRFRQCRLAFNYLYGRDENVCEGPVFDFCMQEFNTTGRIESALAAIATHETFCQ